MTSSTSQRILALKRRIMPSFTASDWGDVGLITNRQFSNEGRLLKSLRFGDDDYGACVGQVLMDISKADPTHLDSIEKYLDDNYPEDSTYISALPAEKKITFAPNAFTIPNKAVENDFVAVMMPFATSFDAVYAAIQAACSASDLRCDRADNVWEHEVVIQDIFDLIYRARIVICDFTGKNPNVMYETGIAHTLGKHVIPLTQSEDDVPFDLKHRRYLKYLNNGEGLASMQTKLDSKLKSMK